MPTSRSSCGAARCRPPAASSSARRSTAARATSSSPRPAHPGLLALAMPWVGAAAHAASMGDARHLGVVHRGHPRRRRGSGDRHPRRPRPARLPARRDRRGDAPPRRRQLRPAGAGSGCPGRSSSRARARRWFRGGPGASDARVRAVRGRTSPRSTSAPNQGTVFSAHQMGTARMGSVAEDPRVRPGRARPARWPATIASSAGSTSPTRRCSRPASGSIRC